MRLIRQGKTRQSVGACVPECMGVVCVRLCAFVWVGVLVCVCVRVHVRERMMAGW